MEATVRDIIKYAPVPEVLAVIERLVDLPPTGSARITDDIQRIKDHWAAASQAEKEAAEHRQAARTEALYLIDICEALWSKKEVRKATGYAV